MSIEGGRKIDKKSQVAEGATSAEDLAALKELTPAELKEKLKAVIVNIDALTEQAARDSAERSLTASQESMKGVSGFIKRAWTHTFAREYYRQKHVSKARGAIRESGDLYAAEEGNTSDGSSHAQTAEALVRRFASEYDETLHEGEDRRKIGSKLEDDRPGSESGSIKHEIKQLMTDYASGTMSDDNFIEAKKQILHTVSRAEGGKENTMYADNLLEIAHHVRNAVEHGKKIEELDLDFDVVLGKAKDSIKTEADYNVVDKAIEFAKKTPLGVLVNESTLAAGVAATYGLITTLTKRVATSRIAAWATFGASAALGAGFMAVAENKRTKEDRRQHARERAQGREFEAGKSPRREEMEQYIYEMRSTSEVTAALRSQLYEQNAEGNQGIKDLSVEQFRTLVETLADAEARIRLMDREKIDLLAYSDAGKVEQERFEFDIARAQVKVDLRKIANAAGLPPGQTFDSLLEDHINTRMGTLTEGDSGIAERNQLFNKMKAKRVAWATVKGLGVGLIAGGLAQETAAFFDDSQTGAVEHLFKGSAADHGSSVHTTAIEGLRRWVAGFWSQGGPTHEDIVQGSHFQLSDGLSAKPDGAGGFEILRGNEMVAGHLHFNPDGTVDATSAKTLADHGIITSGHVQHITTQTHGMVGADDYLKHHPELNTHHVHRDLWYDNDTPHPFDKNELKTWWGGHGNTGIDEHGNYSFTVAHMRPDWSYHHGQHGNPNDLFKDGKLKLLLSVSRGTQAHPVEVPIGPDGVVHIKPDSPEGKLLFDTDAKGHAHFKGRFAEIAQMMGTKNGVDHVRILGTYEGKGLDHVDDLVKSVKDVPTITLTGAGPDNYTVDPFPIIPLYERRPLEPLKPTELKQLTDITQAPFYGYSYNSYGEKNFGLLDRNKYKERMAAELVKNPELDLSGNDLAMIREYLGKQKKGYIEELETMTFGVRPMGGQIDTVITVPAYQEGKNMEKTLRNYAKLKDRSSFELVILENHPAGVARDETAAAITKVQTEFPDLNIVHLHKEFKDKPTIGQVRKYLVDAVMLRKAKAGIEKSVAIVSNDADLEDIDPEYARNISQAFKTNRKLDAIGGKWDFPKTSFEQFPLLHASQRLWHYMDIVIRNTYLKAPELIGRNSAFRSGMYAAIGGYNDHAELAEDLEIGWLIKDARGYDSKRISYLNTAGLVSNPRRAVMKLLSGGELIDQYGDFHVNEEVRKAPLDQLLAEKREFDPTKFANQVQSIYSHYARWKKGKGGWIDDRIVENAFGRAMGFLGVNYKMNGDTVVITDMKRMQEGIKKYPGRPARGEIRTQNKSSEETAPTREDTESAEPVISRAQSPSAEVKTTPKVRAKRVAVRPSATRKSAPRKPQGKPNPTTRNRARPAS